MFHWLVVSTTGKQAATPMLFDSMTGENCDMLSPKQLDCLEVLLNMLLNYKNGEFPVTSCDLNKIINSDMLHFLFVLLFLE